MKLRTAILALTIISVAIPSFAYRTAAWIAPWDQASLTSIQTNAGSLSESNPVWYSLNADGSIARNWNAENTTWRAAMVGTELIPTIQNVVAGRFDGALAETLFSTAEKREAHAEAIAQLVRLNAYDGIDIDYERVPTRARENQTAFFQTLSQKLHLSGKKLSITVYAKTSDSQNWDGPGSQDWIRIGQLADSVKLMAYDYHWSTSAAGPITPLDWLDRVVAYAVSVIAPSKVIVGLPWYGYDWSGSSGTAVTYASAMQLAQANGATITRDANGEPTFTYSGRTVFFQDAVSHERKVSLVRTKYPAVGGFAHWRAGQEDPATWTLVGELRSGTSGSTPALADFTVSGPSTLSAVAGQTSTASFEVIALNGFSGSVALSVQPIAPFAGGSVSFATTSIAPFTPVALTIAPSSATAAGSYQYRLRFVSGSLVKEQTVTISVTSSRKHRTKR